MPEDLLAVIKQQLAKILENQDKSTDQQNRLDRDFDGLIKLVQDLSIAVGAYQAEVGQLRDQIHNLPKKLSEKVGDQVGEAVQPINDALDQVQKKSFWDKLVRKRG